MATRNPANVIEFGKVNFGAPISVFALSGATGIDAQVAPGEDLEKFLEAVQQKGTVIIRFRIRWSPIIHGKFFMDSGGHGNSSPSIRWNFSGCICSGRRSIIYNL